MSEHLTQNQRTAAGVAMLIGAGLTPIGATLYAAEHQPTIEQPYQAPSPDAELPSQAPEKLPTPKISPSSIELPTAKPKATISPTPAPSQPAVKPQSLPITTEVKPKANPKTETTPELPQPILKPLPPKPKPLPSPSPTEKSDTPTVDIEQPTPAEAEPQTITFETVPEAVSKIMSRDTVYLPAFGCSGSLIRDAQDNPIGYTTASHCGLILSDDIGEKAYNRLAQVPIPGTDGLDYLVFPQGQAVQVGDSKDSLTTIGTYSEILVPAKGNRSTDFAIGALDGHSITEVTAAYEANQTPESEVKALKLGDILYSSGWPVNQPDNTSGSLRRQEFAETYLGTMNEVYITSGQMIDNMIITVVAKNKDGAMCSPGKSGAKLFKYDPDTTGNRPDTALGTLTGGHWSFDNPQFPAAVKYFSEKYKVKLNVDEVAAICMYSVDAPTLNDQAKLSTVVKAVAATSEIPGYDKLYSREAMLTQVEANLANPDYSHNVIDGLVQIHTVVEGPEVIVNTGTKSVNKGGYEQLYQTTTIDRPAVLFSPVTGAAVVYALDKSSPNGIKAHYYDNLSYMSLFDRDTIDGVSVMQTTGAITTAPTKGINDSFTDTEMLNFGHIVDNPTIDYSRWATLRYDSRAKQLFTEVTNAGVFEGKGGGK